MQNHAVEFLGRHFAVGKWAPGRIRVVCTLSNFINIIEEWNSKGTLWPRKI